MKHIFQINSEQGLHIWPISQYFNIYADWETIYFCRRVQSSIVKALLNLSFNFVKNGARPGDKSFLIFSFFDKVSIFSLENFHSAGEG